jgi:hypothetical protein
MQDHTLPLLQFIQILFNLISGALRNLFVSVQRLPALLQFPVGQNRLKNFVTNNK